MFPSRAAAPAPASARVNILGVPPRMVLVRIKPPAEHEMPAMLVAVLLGAYGRVDHLGQFAVGLIAALVGRLHVLGVGLDAWQRYASFAFGCLTGAALKLCTGHFGIDFRHWLAPC